MIELRHLTKTYGTFRAVDDVSLSIPAGEVVGLLGHNGAGKTTTLRILTGYMPPSRGSVTVNGHDSVTQSDAIRRSLGYLPEANPLYVEMRVVEYLSFRARLFGIRGVRDRRQAVERVIERCHLTEMRRRLIGRLSKGYRQRVGLAAALLHDPPVLILDEPTSGLDPVQIRETRHLIRELAGNRTMILSSHILPEIEQTCDRIIIMHRGRIQADGAVDEVRQQAGEGRTYIVELQATPSEAPDPFERELKSIAAVRDVTTETLPGGWQRYTIEATREAVDLREAIAHKIHATNRLCRELRRETPSLEQLFIQLTAGVPTARSTPEVAAVA